MLLERIGIKSQFCSLFADRVHISNCWILVQALAHTPVQNYDMLWALYCDHLDQWFITKKGEPVDLTMVII